MVIAENLENGENAKVLEISSDDHIYILVYGLVIFFFVHS